MANQNSDKTNSNNINKGQPIYFKKELHYIVYEFYDNIIISKNKVVLLSFKKDE